MWKNSGKEEFFKLTPKEGFLKLTLAVYRVTALFPAGDDLGLKIRESADKILVDLLLDKYEENASPHIEEILRFFDLAEEKRWVDERNFLVLRREYDKIRPAAETAQGSGKTVENYNNGHRQHKIMAVMSGNGMVKIGDLIKLFPGVNRRTVLRDLDGLCHTGIMVRNGSGRGAYYVKNATMSQ